MLPGRELPPRALGPELQYLAHLGFSFRVDNLKLFRVNKPPRLAPFMLVCFGAEDIVASIEFGLYSTDELIATIQNVCDIHRWTRSRSHPVLVQLDK